MVLALALAYIGLGSNLGFDGDSPAETVRSALRELAGLGEVVAWSSLYATEPVGFSEQPGFVNAVAAVETGLGAEAVLEELLQLERRFGRDRSSGVRNGPRSLDLDLLLLGELAMETEQLKLPHPRLAERRFVLTPLVEIAPELRHPLLGRTMRELLADLPEDGENGVATVTLIGESERRLDDVQLAGRDD